MNISTKAAITRAGGTHESLAMVLGISRQAVSAFGRYLPPRRALELKERKPRWIKPLLLATAAEDAADPAEKEEVGAAVQQ